MRFITMHKMTAKMEQGLPPDPLEMQGIGALMAEMADQKIMVSGEGLKPTSQRIQLRYRHGERTVTQGPFSDASELLAGFALLCVASKEEAIGYCDRVASLLGDVDL